MRRREEVGRKGGKFVGSHPERKQLGGNWGC